MSLSVDYDSMKLKNNLYFYPDNGMGDCNTYVITGRPGLLVDPGLLPCLPALLREMARDGIQAEDIGIIANTHLHFDHCWADDALRRICGAKVVLHPLQRQFYAVAYLETSRYFGMEPPDFSEDECLAGSRLRAGDMELELLPAPGHSPDSIGYYQPAEKILICGDVLFRGNIGRPDLPGGDAAELRRSIERLAGLEIDYLLPGHMDIVTGTAAVKDNFSFIQDNILGHL